MICTMFRTIRSDPKGRCHIEPILNAATWEYYERHLACIWTPNDINWADDRRDYETLTECEQELLKQTLAFFAFADHVVAEAIGEFNIPVMEVKFFHDLQVMIENVHHTVYAQSITEIIPRERDELLRRVTTHPALLEKRATLEQFGDSIGERLLVWACMEGIAFAGAFAVIFYFKNQNKMPGLGTANQYIARDESLHRDFAVHLLNDMVKPPGAETIHRIVRAFVEQEQQYYAGNDILDIGKYVEFVANNLLLDLGLDPIWEINACPLSFMNSLSMRHEVNFFEVTATQYEDAPGTMTFSAVDDDDF